MTQSSLPRISLDKPYGIFSAGLVIILHFCDSLFREIDVGLSELYGENWQYKLQEEDVLPKEFNSRDPQVILKELARNGYSHFRIPLNPRISREKLSFFYNGLDDLLGERNAWVHRQLAENLSELKDLARTTSNLLATCSIDFDYLNWLNDLTTSAEKPNYVTNAISDGETSEILQEIDQEKSTIMEKNHESDIQIGSPVSSRFLTHSYVIAENGDISDRNTGVKLSEFNSNYQKSLQVLLSNLKVGSRLRLTQEGQLCSFLEDHWGYLTKINAAEWFPNHLK